jgi:hypothetical protein
VKAYAARYADDPVPLTGELRGPWVDADVARIDEFNWYESGPRPVTEVRTLYDDDALYLYYDVEDNHIVSHVTDLHGSVHTDSCVECFATPNPGENARYFNFEANPCGTFKMTWMEPGWDVRDIGRDYLSEDLATDVEIATSEPGPTHEPTPDDEGWWLAARFPFDVLSALTGLVLAPDSGDRWRANYHRTGVESRSQEASWNPIGTAEKQFHSPGHFGWLAFE